MEASNGYANGYLKGPKMNGVNGHAVSAKKRSSPAQGPTLFRRLFSIFARLFTWYSIVTILFRCPSTIDLCDETSPKICKPYFQAKHTVSPYVEPYYNTYAAPYVDLAKPYYDVANQHIVVPASAYANKYGAPAWHSAQSYGQAQWEKNIQPQLAVYQQVAQDQYDLKVAPHVSQAAAVVSPYFDIARTSALQTYHEMLLPSYQLAQPYAIQAYDATSRFTTETAVPSALWAWNKTFMFIDTTVWPQVRVLYVQSVEPQLARIGQRLGRYKDKSKSPIESASESLTSHSSSASSSSSTSSASSHASQQQTASQVAEDVHIPDAAEVAQHDETDQVSAPPAGENDSEVRKTARETVQEDLELWQTKFAKAAEEGAAEIEERVDEISRSMIQENALKTGKGLVKNLETTVEGELSALRRAIISIVELKPTSAEEELTSAVRAAGLAVKDKAQDIRDWKGKFELEMEALVTKAAENHFKILESIRDLALQRIGMKWAWMDGITYKDWAKYHELRDRFDEWTSDLKKLIITHPGLDDARKASGEVEDAGMDVAQGAARELSRLKQVSFWKLAAGDVSDNFDSNTMQQAAEAAEQAKIEESKRAAEAAEAAAQAERDAQAAAAEEAAHSEDAEVDPKEEAARVIEEKFADHDLPRKSDDGFSEPEEDPLESAASVIEDASPAIDLVNDEEPVLSEASSAASRAAESFGSATDSASSIVEDFASAASDSSSSILSDAPTADSNDEESSTEIDSLTELASTIIPGDDYTFVVNDTGYTPAEDDEQKQQSPEDKAEQKLEDQLEEEIISESAEDTPVEASTASVKPAFLGAAAQEVPNRGGPILDDDEEETLESLSGKAQDAYANVVAQASQKYSIAMSAVSAKIYGTPEPEPVQEEMFAAVAARYSAATARANAQLNQALEAASKGIYGTPTTTATPAHDWTHVEALAAQRLAEGRIWAEEQYEAAKIALGFATATPTATSERLLEQAKLNYYAGLGAAHARYSEFLEAAATAMSSFTAVPTPTDAAGTVSSVASAATAEANAIASGASVDGMGVISAAGEGVEAAISIAGDAVNAAAQEVLDAAEAFERGVTDTWENVVNQLSVQIYGAPTPTAWYDNAYADVEKYASQASEQAAKQYDVVYNIVQELIIGKEPTFSESVLARLQSAYATGASSAAQYLSEATHAAGDSANAARDKVNAAAAAAADAIRDNAPRDEL